MRDENTEVLEGAARALGGFVSFAAGLAALGGAAWLVVSLVKYAWEHPLFR